MQLDRRAALVGMMVVVLFAAPPAATAGDPSASCRVRLIAAAGKRVSSALACFSEAVAGLPAHARCLARAEARCCTARPPGDCVTTEERTGFEQAAAAFVGDVVSDLSGVDHGVRRCGSAKWRIIANAIQRKLSCHAKAVRMRRPVDLDCLAAAEARWQRQWFRLEGLRACRVTGLLPWIGARMDALLAGVVGPSPTPTGPTPTSTPTPTPTGPTQTPSSAIYDVDFTFDPPIGYREPAVGSFQIAGDGSAFISVTFTEFDSLTLFGTVEAPGKIPLHGYMIRGGDVGFQANGNATFDLTGNEHEVAATVTIPQLGQTIDLIMTRPASGTPPVFAGTYAFAYPQSASGCACSSTALVTIDVPASGFATTLAADDRDAGAALQGVLNPGGCSIAPSGRMFCLTSYAAAAPESVAGHCGSALGSSCFLRMIGNLAAGPSGVTGSGTSVLGSAPSIYAENVTWTAVK